MKKKKGQALVEAALVIPILIMFICGIIDFGRILYTQADLNLVTQESARMAALGKSNDQIRQFVHNNGYPIEPSINPDKPESGQYVTVILTCDVKYITPFVNVVFPTPFKVKTQSTIRVE